MVDPEDEGNITQEAQFNPMIQSRKYCTDLIS